MPVFAWDEGVFVDPILNKSAPPGLAVSSVPYFDERCGSRFKAADIESAFDSFWSRLGDFRPRDFVKSELSMAKSAAAYLELYRRAGDRP